MVSGREYGERGWRSKVESLQGGISFWGSAFLGFEERPIRSDVSEPQAEDSLGTR